MTTYCSCGSNKPGIMERRLRNPEHPEHGRWVLPSFICPDCRNHRLLTDNTNCKYDILNNCQRSAEICTPPKIRYQVNGLVCLRKYLTPTECEYVRKCIQKKNKPVSDAWKAWFLYNGGTESEWEEICKDLLEGYNIAQCLTLLTHMFGTTTPYSDFGHKSYTINHTTICPDCKGTGEYVGLNSREVCQTCKGKKFI